MTPDAGRVLLRRSFTMADQQAFARLSGDFNPMHVDAVLARRTLFGEPVVHGVHMALCALEALLKKGAPASVSALHIQFPKPALTGQRVCFRLRQDSVPRYDISADIEGEAVLEMSVHCMDGTPMHQPILPPLAPEPLLTPDFAALSGQEGELKLGLDSALAETLFPHILRQLGPQGLAEVLALTRLVGMRCPGLHSLFSRLDVTWNHEAAPGALHYRVEKTDARFSLVTLAIGSARLNGSVRAFFRPPPVPQPAMPAIAERVSPQRFAASVALIIGGTRGIGEITAKIIAAGGGLPIITYHQGAADAERVADEIRRWGGRCEMLQLDVRHGGSTIRRFFRGRPAPRSLYYFATPKILRRSRFSHAVLRRFFDYYVTVFGRLADEVAALCPQTLRVFYPSSVFLDENPPGMAEYILAKRAGEELCHYYNRQSTQIEAVVARLPRLQTDQTTSLSALPEEDNASILLPVIMRVEEGVG